MSKRDEPSEDLPQGTTVPAAGQALGLGRNAAYAAAARGEIPTVRIGGRLVVPIDALREMLRERTSRR